ncbi:MAG: hypothetical protein HQ519_11370 [Planctomycetes bacterium]|nr:hypothetical protein [Planctomycetota bacterium]
MRTLMILGPVALGMTSISTQAVAQQTHEYFLWGGTPATTEWEIRRTVDEDGDGNYFGATEGWRFGYDAATDIDYIQDLEYLNMFGTPTMLAIATNDVVLKFNDLNGDGDSLDAGEWGTFIDTRGSHGVSNTSPDDMVYDVTTGCWYVTDDNWNSGSQPGSGISCYVDFNADGDCLDVGEMTPFVDATGSQTVAGTSGAIAIDLGDFEAIMVDSAGTVIGFAQQDRTLYAFEDQNGDGDAMDPGEAWNFCNLVGDKAGLEQNADTLSGALHNPSCPSSSGVGLYASLEILDVALGAGPNGEDLYWIVSTAFNISCAGANALVYQGIDLNGDRDLNDPGEVTLFLDGPNALVMDYNPNTIYGGAAQDDGFVIFHDGGPIGVTYPQNGVDFLFDLNGDRMSDQVGEQETKYRWLPDGCFAVCMTVVPTGEFFVPDHASFTPFGVSDQTSLGTDAVIGNIGLPNLGTPVEVTLQGGIPGGQANLAMGVSNTNSKWGPLPLNLGFLGIPGSNLYTSVGFEFLVAVDAFGGASVPLFVPNNSALAGNHYYFQWQVFDAGSPAGFILSNAGDALVN